MSSEHSSHYVNDRPCLYIYIPPLTPPIQMRSLSGEDDSHDEGGNISPPVYSDTEAGDDGDDDSLCPSPPDSLDEVEGMEWDVPSPPASSPALSDQSDDDSICLSPPASPDESLVEHRNAPSPPVSCAPPAPHAPQVSPTRVTRAQVGFVQDVSSDSPPSSPTNHSGEGRANVPESIPLSSPTISFPWPKIPPSLEKHFEIPYGGNVIELASMSFTPGPICAKPCCQPPLVQAQEFLDGEDVVDIMRVMPTPGLPGIKRTVDAWTPRKQFNAVELRHGGKVQRFSPWALSAWHGFVIIREAISQWQRATERARKLNDHETLTLLQSFRWDMTCGIKDTTLPSIARLGTPQWLNDEAISMLIYMVNMDLKGTRSRMLTSYASNYIRSSWHEFQRGGTRAERRWIHQIYEDFKSGELEQLGICVHVLAGAGPHTQGNHWIGVVIDARTSTISFGDSLYTEPHNEVVTMTRWFLEPAFQHVFSIDRLPSSRQPGNWSCGDYSVNMVAHNLLPDRYPLVGSRETDAMEHRIHLFRRALTMVQDLVCSPVPFPW